MFFRFNHLFLKIIFTVRHSVYYEYFVILKIKINVCVAFVLTTCCAQSGTLKITSQIEVLWMLNLVTFIVFSMDYLIVCVTPMTLLNSGGLCSAQPADGAAALISWEPLRCGA